MANAVALFLTLETFIAELREKFDQLLHEARNLMPDVKQELATVQKRRRRRKHQADDSREPDTNLEGAQKFRVETFFVIIDKILVSLVQRCRAYKQISQDFAFIQSLQENDLIKLKLDVSTLVTKYTRDLESNCIDEFLNYSEFVTHLKLDRDPRILMQHIRGDQLLESTFPNVSTALRLFLTLPVTVCEGERSFSKLTLIKSHLRSTMGQNRLNALAIMSIENDVASTMSFESTINKFSCLK